MSLDLSLYTNTIGVAHEMLLYNGVKVCHQNEGQSRVRTSISRKNYKHRDRWKARDLTKIIMRRSDVLLPEL